jgi:hypothetical protein
MESGKSMDLVSRFVGVSREQFRRGCVLTRGSTLLDLEKMCALALSEILGGAPPEEDATNYFANRPYLADCEELRWHSPLNPNNITVDVSATASSKPPFT